MAETLTRYDTDKIPLAIADKAMFIHHLNEEHQDELAMFINAFTPASVGEYDIVSIKELYPDGLLLDVMTMNRYQNNSNALKDRSSTDNTLAENLSSINHQYFINFFVPISNAETLHEQYIALLQASATKLGKRTIKLQEQHFSVIDGYYVSPNMYRLVVTAPDNIPLNHPGYAYLFELNADVLSTINGESENNDKPLQRYYTLRKAWRDPIRSSVQAWIDVYIHGDTPGSNWARSLVCGMPIKTVRDYPEKIEHLSEGQCLLICDETSLPTVANLLENWQNPLPPLVIAITEDPEDISYLHTLNLCQHLGHDERFLQDNLLHIIKTPTTDLSEQIMSLLHARLITLPLKIGKVWGALEAADIKSLRQRLKSTLGLSRQDMVIKVYWRAQ